jgi:hypothetical protein
MLTEMVASKALLLTMLCVPVGPSAAQTPAAPAPAASAPAPTLPSAILQPSLAALELALGALRADKWKAPGSAKETTQANIDSIKRDLQATLPALEAKADAAPGSLSEMLALTRNVDALYDVVLRVTDTADLAAPDAQRTAIDQALSGLLSARRTLADQMQSAALAQEQQVRDLQKQLNERLATTVPASLPPPPPAQTTKKAVKPAAKAVKKPLPASGLPQAVAPASPKP